MVLTEHSVFGELLVDRVEESYHNLTLKTLALLRHFVRNEEEEYLLKADDDSYVGIGKWIFFKKKH